jgi:hypothetical protein
MSCASAEVGADLVSSIDAEVPDICDFGQENPFRAD